MNNTKTFTGRLSDGRGVRSLPRLFTSQEMFKLAENCLFSPSDESIMLVKDLDVALNKNDVWKTIRTQINRWRSGNFCFYHQDFAKPLGSKLFWIEHEERTARMLIVSLDIPDEPVQTSSGHISLQKAVGMGFLPISKLELETVEDNPRFVLYKVSLKSTFNSETDLAIKDLFSGWSNQIDNDGFGLAKGYVSYDQGDKNKDARFSSVLDDPRAFDFHIPEEVEAVLRTLDLLSVRGWLGFTARAAFEYGVDARRFIISHGYWSSVLAVAIIEKNPDSVIDQG